MPKYSGLCENCEHDATCLLRRSTVLKIIQCEEFSIQPIVAQPGPAKTEDVYSGEPSMGLCANCVNIPTCGFPNARQGVVQCEEYVLDEAGVIPPEEPKRSRSAA